MLKICSVLIALGIIVSCNSNYSSGSQDQQNNSSIPKTLSDSLYKQTMDEHNLGMAKMGEMIRYREAITNRKNSPGASQGNGTGIAPVLDSTLQALNMAEEEMNRWMQSFDPDKAGNTEAEKENYYRKEKEKIAAINTSIFESLEAAKRVLE